jgi:20S proteasome subunit beta 1
MSREEAEEYVLEAVALAISQDSSSGGCIRLVTINEAGAHRRFIPGSQIPLYQDDNIRPIAGGIVV